MKRIGCFLVILVYILTSCYTKRDLTGIYNKINRGGKYPPYMFFVELNKDSTFSYGYGGGSYSEVSQGYWRTDSRQKRLMLTGFSDTDHLPLIVEEIQGEDKRYHTFILVDPLKTVEWTLICEGKRYVFESDTLKLPVSIPVDSFYISGYKDYTNVYPDALQERINSVMYKIKDKGNNVFSIDFPSYVDYNIFRFLPLQDTLKIRRNTLIWKRKGYMEGYILKLKRVKPRTKRK